MSPFHSSYYDSVPSEDAKLLEYLAWRVTPHFVRAVAGSFDDIRKKFSTSTSWCHLAARAVATAFSDKGLTFVDGTFFEIVFTKEGADLARTTHSWCRTKHGTILDISPIGVLTFSPLLIAREANVLDTEWGYAQEKYVEEVAVEHEVRKLVGSDKFKKAFPVYLSLLRSARAQADRVEPIKPLRRKR